MFCSQASNMSLIFITSLVTVFLALFSFTSVAQQCLSLPGSPFESCMVVGYNSTYAVPYELSEDLKDWLSSTVPYLLSITTTNCSAALMGETIMCALYAPSCTEGKPNPILPCQRVCSEFLKRCRSDIDPFWLEYYVGYCTLLPNKTASSGQCFEPRGFDQYYNASTKGLLEDKCNRLIFPWCKGTGYEYTIIKESTQITTYNDVYSKNFTNNSTKDEVSMKDSEISFMNEMLANNSNCAMDIRKMLCADYFPPCFPDEGLAFYTVCNSVCKDISKKCPGTKHIQSFEAYFQHCEMKAFGESSHGFCRHTKWPKPMEWLHLFRDGRLKVPPKQPNNELRTSIIVVAVVVPLIVIGLAILGVILWRQRKLPWLCQFTKQADDTKGFVKEELY